MPAQLDLGGISVDVVFKDIKNIHLSVYPPTGRVRISAPQRMKLNAVRVFAISKLDWIKRQRVAIQGQERETPRECLERESHYLWGRRYLLHIREADAAPGIQLTPGKMVLCVRRGDHQGKKHTFIARFYREQIREAVPPLIESWAPVLGVTVDRFYVRQMKTKWGSCNPGARSIRLNTELAKKPKECLEYIVVHEMAHLLEPTHNARFISLMELVMPNFQHLRDLLNRLPVRHEHWKY